MMKKNNQKKRMRTAIPFLAILVIFVLFKILQPERFGTAHSINVLIQQTLMQSIIGCGLYFLNEMGIFIVFLIILQIINKDHVILYFQWELIFLVSTIDCVINKKQREQGI